MKRFTALFLALIMVLTMVASVSLADDARHLTFALWWDLYYDSDDESWEASPSATGKDSENVSVSRDWLSSNEGKSLTMDYWIHNGMGASFARLGDNANAISSLEKAVGVYYKLFNTSEKGIKSGNFHDNNLGSTLYRLGRVYAAEGKVRMTETYCSLAAKCGYQPAIDFCDQYKIKY